jgi:hypothetical protein
MPRHPDVPGYHQMFVNSGLHDDYLRRYLWLASELRGRLPTPVIACRLFSLPCALDVP